MRNWALSLIALIALLAAPVAATPPQIVWVNDHLFGITETEVLILRTIHDNHGFYQTEQTDTFLIVRDLATGRDISHNIIERVVAHGEGIVPTHYPMDDAYNPYAIRANMKAAPLTDPRAHYLDVEVWDDALRASDHNGVTHFARWADVLPLADASLRRTRDRLPILKMEGDADFFDPDGFLQPAACDVQTALGTAYLATVDVMLVQLSCEDPDFGGRNLIWVTLPKV